MAQAGGAGRHIVLTGTPGVGKTTIVCKVRDALLSSSKKEESIPLSGFVTEETRDQGVRSGFRVVTVDGKIAPLATVSSSSRYRVGKYGVEVEAFEDTAIPSLQATTGIVLLDEIGKMEMFSKKFKDAVQNIFSSSSVRVIATIPIPKGQPIPFVEQIQKRNDIELFTVSKANRDALVEEILHKLTNK